MCPELIGSGAWPDVEGRRGNVEEEEEAEAEDCAEGCC